MVYSWWKVTTKVSTAAASASQMSIGCTIQVSSKSNVFVVITFSNITKVTKIVTGKLGFGPTKADGVSAMMVVKMAKGRF